MCYRPHKDTSPPLDNRAECLLIIMIIVSRTGTEHLERQADKLKGQKREREGGGEREKSKMRKSGDRVLTPVFWWECVYAPQGWKRKNVSV